MTRKNEIKIIEPKPYEKVGAAFVVSGWIPKKWLHQGTYTGLGFCLVDADCIEFSCGNLHVERKLFDAFRTRVWFTSPFQLNTFNAPFIAKGGGRIVIALDGKEKNQKFYLPIIVKGFENFEESEKAVNIQKTIGTRLEKIKSDLEDYYQELRKIGESRRQKDATFKEEDGRNNYADVSVGYEMLKLLDDNENESFENYLYSEEDKKEKELNEKYKDALDWRGPLLHGLIAKFDAFELRIHSNDHGKHFHVMHRGKGINARFSFPEIALISYVTGTTIGAKTTRKIQEFCRKPDIFFKLEKEFAKRS